MASPVPSKQVLRDQVFAQRLKIPPAVQEQAALSLRDNFLNSFYLPKGTTVSAYMPINAEISALPLCDVLIERGYTVLMPRVVPDNTQLEFRAWTRKTPTIKSLYGIEEPDPAHAAVHIPDLFLVPLLAFDRHGHRLGYGAGYYDRTFAGMKGKIPFRAVGVAYELQCFEAVPVEGHDYTLDMCVTESKVHAFAGDNKLKDVGT